jgi:hypothetical protein
MFVRFDKTAKRRMVEQAFRPAVKLAKLGGFSRCGVVDGGPSLRSANLPFRFGVGPVPQRLKPISSQLHRRPEGLLHPAVLTDHSAVRVLTWALFSDS